jgi:23S rRNA pseudouridine2604 synthase
MEIKYNFIHHRLGKEAGVMLAFQYMMNEYRVGIHSYKEGIANMAKRTKKLTSQEAEGEEIRINKYLSEAGVCSRREADRYIEEGKIYIDGVKAEMGSKVGRGSVVTFMGKPVKKEEKLVLIALNKPQGIVCTTDPREPDNIIDFINYGMRIYPIGRLDKDSEGLILLTNDGNIVNKILRAENHHEKEYIVTVNKEITPDFIRGMSQGVPILDTVTRPCEVTPVDKFTFRIILTQGLNRQIRRMCEYFGYRVINLTRIRIMNIKLGRLKTGNWRNVTEKEIEELNRLLQNSSKESKRHRMESKSGKIMIKPKDGKKGDEQTRQKSRRRR